MPGRFPAQAVEPATTGGNESCAAWGPGVARPLRLQAPGALHHVVARGNEQRAVFLGSRDWEDYLERLVRCRDRFGFSLYAYCLMTNHVHLAIEEGELGLSKIMHVLHSTYAQAFNRRHGRVGHLFQGRFKSYLVDRERYLLALLRYIHLNPVRAGIVTRPEAYRWSSARFFRGGRQPQWLDVDRVFAILGPNRCLATAGYRALIGEDPDDAYEDVPALAGAVKGDARFAARAIQGACRTPLRPAGWDARRLAGAVAASHGLTLRRLSDRSQARVVSRPRILAACLGRNRFGIPVAEFARLFKRDESSLLRGVLALERRLEGDAALQRQLDLLEAAAVEENTGLHD